MELIKEGQVPSPEFSLVLSRKALTAFLFNTAFENQGILLECLSVSYAFSPNVLRFSSIFLCFLQTSKSVNDFYFVH